MIWRKNIFKSALLQKGYLEYIIISYHPKLRNQKNLHSENLSIVRERNHRQDGQNNEETKLMTHKNIENKDELEKLTSVKSTEDSISEMGKKYEHHHLCNMWEQRLLSSILIVPKS